MIMESRLQHLLTCSARVIYISIHIVSKPSKKLRHGSTNSSLCLARTVSSGACIMCVGGLLHAQLSSTTFRFIKFSRTDIERVGSSKKSAAL